jgi:hypothetical protein
MLVYVSHNTFTQGSRKTIKNLAIRHERNRSINKIQGKQVEYGRIYYIHYELFM